MFFLHPAFLNPIFFFFLPGFAPSPRLQPGTSLHLYFYYFSPHGISRSRKFKGLCLGLIAFRA